MAMVLGSIMYGVNGRVQEQLWGREVQAALQTSTLVSSSLEKIMLANTWDQAEEVLQTLGQKEEAQIEDIALYDEEYRLLSFVSGFPKGRAISERSLSKTAQDEGCLDCHRLPAAEMPAVMIVDLEGEPVVRSVVPFYNEAACQRCHIGQGETLGAGLVDYRLERFRQASAQIGWWLLAGGVLSIALVIFGVYLLLDRTVLARLNEFLSVTRAVAEGNWDVRVQVRNADELGQLGTAFNDMTVRLRQVLQRDQKRTQGLQEVVQQYTRSLVAVAQGNLSAQIPLDGADVAVEDPIVDLGRDLNTMISGLRGMALQIRDAAENLASATGEIVATTKQQAAGAGEQSVAILQASSTIDEVLAIAQQTAQRAQGVAEVAQRTAEVSLAGQQAVAETVASMNAVKAKVETIATGILALSEQAQAIGQIIVAVSDIASQSNMLALNAAVEAARAGEAGRGFAVVAGEVRALAEQSRAATTQVKQILSEIQNSVNAAVMLTEEGMKGADAGLRVVEQSGEAIRRLAESVAESEQAAALIAAAADQQVLAMGQLAQAMQNIQQGTGQTAVSTQQTERAAQELSALATGLRQAVEQYQL
jgi:methyl-accepting chemotaxis protein